MTDPRAPQQTPKVIDDLSAPQVYTGEAVWFSLSDNKSIAHITFVTPRQNPATGETIYVTNLRIVMPAGAAQRMAITLFDYLKKEGIDTATKSEGSQVQ